ncbi:unnamed protein product [Bursaphelenchus xylophilus]|uniref:(pine wood nematode) hypothetical protein n=1 Tax=Bursaphelenchus xylophilus TaxID=6326 RepID=A0A7I8WN43_BURXY|nr:unnamed protein product [Bursaphelenchus xylophilus]CAG9092883.1 unnamed protein product [Bursaphelenchus xylophilus]
MDPICRLNNGISLSKIAALAALPSRSNWTLYSMEETREVGRKPTFPGPTTNTNDSLATSTVDDPGYTSDSKERQSGRHPQQFVLRMWLKAVRLVLCMIYYVQVARGIRQESELNLDFELHKEPGEKYYRADIKDDDVVDMYQKWVDTGLSSLMSAVANHKLKRQRRSVIQKYGECSSSATDIPKHAKCLTKLLKNEIKAEVKPRHFNRLQRYQQEVEGFKTLQTDEELKRTSRRLQKYRKEDAGRKTVYSVDEASLQKTKERSRRSAKVVASESYNLKTNKENITPFGHIAKILMESVKKIKGKSDIPRWQSTVEKLRANGAKRKKYKELIENDSEENLQSMNLGLYKEKMVKKNPASDVDLEKLLKDPEELKKFIKKKKIPKTKEEKVVDMIRSGLKLMYNLAGKNTTNFEERNMKLVSPRFLGVVPEEKKDDEINLISPSLFSLHDEGEGIENLTSLPTLLKSFTSQDQQLWLDIIMEAAGVNEQSEKLEQDLYDMEINKTRSSMTNITNLVDENGTPLYATKDNATELGASPEYIAFFEQLQTNYTKEQLREMNTTGYTILKKNQIQMLYGPQSPHADDAVYNRLMNMTEKEIHDHLQKDFDMIAEMDNFQIDQSRFERSQHVSHSRRKKRLLPGVILSPVSFAPLIANPLAASQPFVLSPIIFTPLILSPSVFGPIVLSPWIFTPLILSPRILGVIVLSPFMFNPLILSPFALIPAVLSPGLFTPVVLSPLLMVPFVMSPQVFTPIILSPLCLSPIILNPMVGSPLILSPFVLSPIIASPMALSALVLSPYALSPVIWSPLIAFAAVLSPSWLS